MSYYTRFADVESLLTSTTTATVGTTDIMLVFCNSDQKYHTAQVGVVSMGGGGFQSLTSASTATNITPVGVTTLNSSNAIAFVLTGPTAAGIIKTITTSSTAVITITTSSASLSSTGAINGGTIALNSAGAAISGGSISLVSVGTTRWNTLAYSGTTVLT